MKIINLGVNDEFVKHGSVALQMEKCGLTIDGIANALGEKQS